MTIGADCGIHLFFIRDIPGKTEKKHTLGNF